MREHLQPHDIAAYIDGTLDDDARAQLEDHLAECTACRAELVGAHRALRAKPFHRRPIVLGPLVAAAAVLLFVVIPGEPASNPAQPVFRAGSDTLNGIQRIAAVQPSAGASIAPADRTFIWHAVDEGANYRMTLTQLNGTRVWSFETVDTVATVPDSIQFVVGDTYLWVVDALLADGSQAKTEVRSFRVER